ncbi:hypothetical protein Pcinc_041091 [Petrolisthes cinctipes]|uniref:Uncharacterized protein n=1 Tax=Petrolisthes cinctipes TaxID=88211 RepID=A0AAE1BKX2_PETCI|nr:hypothetical protein Pcinc_041091 [Petrolisthes cinctipes]
MTIILMVELGWNSVFPEFVSSFPPYRTDHTLKLLWNSEEQVLDAKYELLPPDCNTSWVLAFYFFSTQDESWESGVMIKHIVGRKGKVDVCDNDDEDHYYNESRNYDDSENLTMCDNTFLKYSKDLVKTSHSDNAADQKILYDNEDNSLRCDDVEDSIIIFDQFCKVHEKSQSDLLSQSTVGPLTFKLRVAPSWLKVTVKAGIQTLFQQRGKFSSYKKHSHFPNLKLAVTCLGIDCDLQRVCENVKLPSYPPHQLLTTTRFEKEEEVLEAEFDIHPKPDFEEWHVMFEIYTIHQKHWMMMMKMDVERNGTDTIENVTLFNHYPRKQYQTDSWIIRTSYVKTEQTFRLEMRAWGTRLYETTAGQRRLRAESNMSLAAAFPDLWVLVFCTYESRCVTLTSACRKVKATRQKATTKRRQPKNPAGLNGRHNTDEENIDDKISTRQKKGIQSPLKNFAIVRINDVKK